MRASVTEVSCGTCSHEDHIHALDEINLTFNGKTRKFHIAPHFYDRLNERTKGIDLCDSLLNAIYIEKRPNNVLMIIKHGVRAFYLWDDTNRVVYVIEEYLPTRELNTLKTVYAALDSDWLLVWQSTHPKVTRKRFREVFHDDQVFK